MRQIVYFVGAGVTKSLEHPAYRLPLMTDFVEVMADYLDELPILTFLAELENAGLYELHDDKASALARRVVGKNRDLLPQTLAEFKTALKSRPAESIEVLLEKALLGKNMSAQSVAARFNYATSRMLLKINWNVDLTALETLVAGMTVDPDTRHTFVSFNYDLLLDRAIQRCAGHRWNPDTGYGFAIPYFVVDEHPASRIAGPIPSVAAFRFWESTGSQGIQLLKPHGSLNWLQPYHWPYRSAPYGIEFEQGPTFVPLTQGGEIRYWSWDDHQHVKYSNEPPREVGILMLPPCSAKQADLDVLNSTRQLEFDALCVADEAYVLGWSIPATDEDQEHLIRAAMIRRQRPLDRLTVVNRSAPATYFSRVKDIFGVDANRLRIFNEGFVEFVHHSTHAAPSRKPYRPVVS
jgi:hypothetical protein